MKRLNLLLVIVLSFLCIFNVPAFAAEIEFTQLPVNMLIDPAAGYKLEWTPYSTDKRTYKITITPEGGKAQSFKTTDTFFVLDSTNLAPATQYEVKVTVSSKKLLANIHTPWRDEDVLAAVAATDVPIPHDPKILEPILDDIVLNPALYFTYVKVIPAVIDAKTNTVLTPEMQVQRFFKLTDPKTTFGEVIFLRNYYLDNAEAAAAILPFAKEKYAEPFTISDIANSDLIAFAKLTGDYDLFFAEGKPQEALKQLGINFDEKNRIIKAKSVVMSEKKLSIPVGSTGNVSAVISPENASNPRVTWSSDEEEVATVDQLGNITALKKGSARIYATAKDGSSKKAYTSLTVTQPVTGISLDQSSITVAVGSSKRLKATIEPENASNDDYEFFSSNEKVATVSDSGTVRGKAPGTAMITVVSEDGEFVANCEVTSYQPVKSVSISDLYRYIKIGESYQLEAHVNPDDAHDLSIEWSSSKPKYAQVDQTGLVTGIDGGSAYIYAQAADDKKASTYVTIAPEQSIAKYNAEYDEFYTFRRRSNWTPKQIRSLFGKPKEISYEYSGVESELGFTFIHMFYEYSDKVIRFTIKSAELAAANGILHATEESFDWETQSTFTYVNSTDEDIVGPRGIVLGMDADEVMSRFKHNHNTTFGNYTMLYRSADETNSNGIGYKDGLGLRRKKSGETVELIYFDVTSFVMSDGAKGWVMPTNQTGPYVRFLFEDEQLVKMIYDNQLPYSTEPVVPEP